MLSPFWRKVNNVADAINKIIATFTVIVISMLAIALLLLSAADYEPSFHPLTTTEAGCLVSTAPEFSHFATLRSVKAAHNNNDSAKHYATADFDFVEIRSLSPINATGYFRFYDRAWNLSEFSYNTVGKVKSVELAPHHGSINPCKVRRD